MILAAGLARWRAANRSSAPGMRGKIRMLPLAERTLIGPRRLGSSQMQRIDLSSPGLTPRRGIRIHCAPGQRRLGMSRRLQPSRKIGHRDTSLCRAVARSRPCPAHSTRRRASTYRLATILWSRTRTANKAAPEGHTHPPRIRIRAPSGRDGNRLIARWPARHTGLRGRAPSDPQLRVDELPGRGGLE